MILDYLDTKDWFGSVGYIVRLYTFSFFSILNGIFSDNSIIMLSSQFVLFLFLHVILNTAACHNADNMSCRSGLSPIGK